MLNKDEYNQEEYNNYYRQEVEGAEIRGGKRESDEEGGSNKLILPLVLVALGIAGFFGYKTMSGDSSDETIDTTLKVSAESALPQTMQSDMDEEEEPTPTEDSKVADKPTSSDTKKVETVTAKVTDEVQKAVSQKGEIDPNEVASIVESVMQQMNANKYSDGTSKTTTAEKEDKELMNKLSNTDVDSVTADLTAALNDVNINENTHIDNGKQHIDVYNKVNVQNESGEDSLSKLSDQINSVISEEGGVAKNPEKEYTEGLKKEVVSREKEMRIIIVKKGDTLGKLAKRAYGNVMEYKRIYKANPEITRPDRIYIGQKIRIPID